MKNKLLILNIFSIIILYHLVYHFLFNFLIGSDDFEITPVGFIISNYNHMNSNISDFILSIIIFIINISICFVLLYYNYKYYTKKSFLHLFCSNILVFVIVSLLLALVLLLAFFTPAGMLIGIFIFLYAPMPIMAILIPFIFKLNEAIMGDQK